MELDLALRAVAAPVAAMAVACWLLVALVTRAARTRAARPAGSPSAVGWPVCWALTTLAVLPVAWAVAVQEPSWRDVATPTVSYQWIGWAAVAAALVSSAVSVVPGRLMSVAAAAVASLVACVMVKPPGLPDASPKLIAAFAAALAGVGAITSRGGSVDERGAVPAWATLAGWWACLAVASGMVLLSGFAKLAVACGALSASAAAWAVMSAIAPRLACAAPAVAGAFAATLGVLCLVARGYDESGFPAWCWWLLAAAPGAGVLSAWPARRGRTRIAAAVAFVAPPAVAIVALLCARAPARVPAESPSLGDYARAGAMHPHAP
jgi:hypothetical protein